jgi:hypothetical protein
MRKAMSLRLGIALALTDALNVGAISPDRLGI